MVCATEIGEKAPWKSMVCRFAAPHFEVVSNKADRSSAQLEQCRLKKPPSVEINTVKHLLIMSIAFTLSSNATAEAVVSPIKYKSGLWDITMEIDGKSSPLKSSRCMDAKLDKDLFQQAMNGDEAKKCKQTNIRDSAGSFEYDYSCVLDKHILTGHSKISGNFDSEFTLDQKGRFEPPMHGMGATHQIFHYRYQGACPANMKAGDVNINGMIVPQGLAKEGQAKGARDKLDIEQLRRMMEQMGTKNR